MLKDDCLFCRIINRSIKSTIALETDQVIAFHDVNPMAPIHLLIVPKYHFTNINELSLDTAPLIGAMMLLAKQLAQDLGVSEDGYRLVFNTNEGAGQSVFHLHLHFLAGRPFSWPPG